MSPARKPGRPRVLRGLDQLRDLDPRKLQVRKLKIMLRDAGYKPTVTVYHKGKVTVHGKAGRYTKSVTEQLVGGG
jgi:hypothetical protein